MSEIWSRRNVLATLLTSILMVAIFFYENSDEEIGTETAEASDTSDVSLPSISISSIHLSEVAMDLPAVFEIGIVVSRHPKLSARNIDITLDFGRAEVNDCGFSPMKSVRKYVQGDKSYRRLEVVELRQNETFYIRCLLNTPIFNKVTIISETISSGKSITYEEYKDRLLSEPLGFWKGLGRIFVIFLFCMICFKIVGFLFRDS